MILEAMIAILIFSMGILALVGMQATAINTASDAKYRSTAGFLADQMIGTVWAARQNATTAGVSNVIVANPDPSFACNPLRSGKWQRLYPSMGGERRGRQSAGWTGKHCDQWRPGDRHGGMDPA